MKNTEEKRILRAIFSLQCILEYHTVGLLSEGGGMYWREDSTMCAIGCLFNGKEMKVAKKSDATENYQGVQNIIELIYNTEGGQTEDKCAERFGFTLSEAQDIQCNFDNDYNRWEVRLYIVESLLEYYERSLKELYNEAA